MCDDGSQLRYWRRRYGLTQQALAARLGWQKQKISQLERHPERARVRDWLHIAWTLQVPVIALFPRLATSPHTWEVSHDATP